MGAQTTAPGRRGAKEISVLCRLSAEKRRWPVAANAMAVCLTPVESKKIQPRKHKEHEGVTKSPALFPDSFVPSRLNFLSANTWNWPEQAHLSPDIHPVLNTVCPEQEAELPSRGQFRLSSPAPRYSSKLKDHSRKTFLDSQNLSYFKTDLVVTL
jgi:hypothetical protein